MLWHLLGWITVAGIVLMTVVVSYGLWLAAERPWMLRPTIPSPREPDALVWETPEQDRPIPWI